MTPLSSLFGGPDGLEGLFGKPLWQASESMWRDLGAVSVNADLAERVVAGVKEELDSIDPTTMIRERDEVLLALLRLKASADALP